MPGGEIMSKYMIIIEDDPNDDSGVKVELVLDLDFSCDTSELSLPPETLADKIWDIMRPLIRAAYMEVTSCKTRLQGEDKNED